ncbi:MAG TPA: antibiotic biosynthesis monooxygenase [Gammaproteobacteria bacterium]|nr:antibiotic biosynthesis monooxygenase [Gammaproteobacteria bacterium]
MYAVIRRYQFDPSASEELDRKIRENFMPLLKDVPGFVTYYWLNSGEGSGASLSVFDSQEGAEESVRAAANFTQQHLSGLTMSKPEILEGEVQAQA